MKGEDTVEVKTCIGIVFIADVLLGVYIGRVDLVFH